MIGNPSPNSETLIESEFVVQAKDALPRLKATAEKGNDVLYIYYTGHSDIQGNWILDTHSKITCDEVIQLLADVKYEGKVFIVMDCAHSGMWVKRARQLFKQNPELFASFWHFNIKSFTDAFTKINWGSTRNFLKF